MTNQNQSKKTPLWKRIVLMCCIVSILCILVIVPCSALSVENGDTSTLGTNSIIGHVGLPIDISFNCFRGEQYSSAGRDYLYIDKFGGLPILTGSSTDDYNFGFGASSFFNRVSNRYHYYYHYTTLSSLPNSEYNSYSFSNTVINGSQTPAVITTLASLATSSTSSEYDSIVTSVTSRLSNQSPNSLNYIRMSNVTYSYDGFIDVAEMSNLDYYPESFDLSVYVDSSYSQNDYSNVWWDILITGTSFGGFDEFGNVDAYKPVSIRLNFDSSSIPHSADSSVYASAYSQALDNVGSNVSIEKYSIPFSVVYNALSSSLVNYLTDVSVIINPMYTIPADNEYGAINNPVFQNPYIDGFIEGYGNYPTLFSAGVTYNEVRGDFDEYSFKHLSSLVSSVSGNGSSTVVSLDNFNLVGWLGNSLGAIMDINLIGPISLGLIVYVALGAGFIFLILRFFAGG